MDSSSGNRIKTKISITFSLVFMFWHNLDPGLEKRLVFRTESDKEMKQLRSFLETKNAIIHG